MGPGTWPGRPGLFTPDDLALVPDSGARDGSEIEIAEKSILWLRIVTRGKQCHASTPHKGINAFEAGSHLVVRLGGLAGAFPLTDRLFDPPVSTFVPTKKEANVPNINTLPGDDVFCLDCRVLPAVDLDAVMAEIRKAADGIQRDFGVSVEVQTVQRASSPATRADAPIVTSLAARCAASTAWRRGRSASAGGPSAPCCARRASPRRSGRGSRRARTSPTSGASSRT